MTIGCPNHAAVNHLEAQNRDYRVEQLKYAGARAKAQDLQKQALALAIGAPHEHVLPCRSFSHTNLKSPCVEGHEAKDTAKSIISRLLYQLDVASNVYIAYTVIGLFFPTPVVLHKTSVVTRIKVSETIGRTHTHTHARKT